MQEKQGLKISQKINVGFAIAFILAMISIYVVIEQKVKPDLIEQRQEQIELSQKGMVSVLQAKLETIQLLTSSLASAGMDLPKDESLFKQALPAIIDNHGNKSIAGGGIWPEPSQFTEGVDRRSFFWGRNNGTLQYLDDYNDPAGSGYHNEAWYQVGKQGQPGICDWSEAYTDPFTKTPMITCTVTMKKAGVFTGVATVDMMLDGITNLLNKYGEENGGYAFAIDQTGQVISFPGNYVSVKSDGSMVKVNELSQLLPWFQSVAQTLVSGVGSSELIEIPDDAVLKGEAYANLVSVPNTGWKIGLVVPKSHMTSLANDMGLFLILSVGASLAFMLIVGLVFFRGVLSQINQTSQQIRNLASGQSGQNEKLAVLRHDEVGSLRNAVNAYGDKLKGMVEQIHQESSTLLSEATGLNQFSNDFLRKAQSLRDENTMLATGAHEMGATSQEVARHANDTRVTVESIHQDIRGSSQEMELVIKAMQVLSDVINEAQQTIIKLDEDSSKVNSMLNVIRDISDQTNLLALNAAIEAARAGESGRGFAVVADEVRNLAAKSQSSAVEIEQVIGRLQSASRASVASMEEGQAETQRAVDTAQNTYQHLQAVVEAFGQIAERATQIAVAAEEQERVTHEMNEQVTRLNNLTDSNADDSAQLHKMSNAIADVASRLNTLR